MTKQNIQQAVALADMLNESNSYIVTNLYTKLLRLSYKWTKLDTEKCNGDISDIDYDTTSLEIMTKITELLSRYSIYIYHQSDPRGVSLYLGRERLASHNYTNGLAIY